MTKRTYTFASAVAAAIFLTLSAHGAIHMRA